jgi:hypothetical protein
MIVHYWDELLGASNVSLAAPADDVVTTISVSPATAAAVGQILQVGSELMEVTEVLSGGSTYTVRRGSHGSTAAAHGSGAAVFHLARRVFVIAFPRQFFGSPASGSFSYSAALANARVCGVELFMTNGRGNGEAAKASYTGLSDGGVRTLSGGQLNLQVQGHLAIETNAAPPVVVERARSVRDVFAVVKQAPVGDPVVLRVRRDAGEYCVLTIPAGSNVSNTIPGASLAPLPALSKLYLDIVSVGQNALSAPGRDLTVTIRL